MYTNGGNHPDQTFGALEITGNGWTTGTGDFTINPLYNCNLKGSGPITINHRGKSGIVNFCGDHSGFTGAINFATDADKGVALAPAGTGRTTGVAAKTINVLSGTTVGISDSTNGTIIGSGTIVSVGAMPNASLQTHLKATTWTGTVWIKNVTVTSFDLAQYGHAKSTIRLTGFKGYSPNSNDGSKGFDGTVELKDDGNTKAWMITDTYASTYYVAKLTGDGTFTTQTDKSGPARYAFKNVEGFSGSIDLANTGRSVTIGEVTQASDYVGAKNQNTIKILSGASATIATGKTWRAGSGVVVNGMLNVNGTLENEVSGSGRIGYTKFNKVHTNVKTGLKKATWTGKLVITGDGAINEGTVDGAAYTTLNEYGSGASKIELAGTCSGYFGLSTKTGSEANPTVVQPELVVSGTWSQNSGYSQTSTKLGYSTIFRKVSGTGTMSSPSGNPNQLYYIEDASEFKGTLEAISGKFVIGSRVDNTLITNGTITIKEGETIPSGLTWKASAGITLNGTVDFESAPSTGDIALTNGADNGTVTLGETAAYTVAGVADTKLALKVDSSKIVLVATIPTYEEVTEDTPLEQIVPAAQAAILSNAGVTADKVAVWAKTKGGFSGTDTAGQEINLEAFALDCVPSELATAKENFKVDITIAANGTITVTSPEGYNVTPVIKGKANLSDTEWTENCENAKFFKAFIELK